MQTKDITVSRFMAMCDKLERSKDTCKYNKFESGVYMYIVDDENTPFNKATTRVAKWLLKHHSFIIKKEMVANGDMLLFAVDTYNQSMVDKLDVITKLVSSIMKKRGVSDCQVAAVEEATTWLIGVEMTKNEGK